MKMVRLSALRTDKLYYSGNIPGIHFIVHLWFLQFIVKWRAKFFLPVVRYIDTKLHVQDSIFLLLALCPFLLLVQRSLLCPYLRRNCPSPDCPWRTAHPPAWSFDQTLIYTHTLLGIVTVQTSSKFYGLAQSVSLLTTRHDTLFSEKLSLYSIRK